MKESLQDHEKKILFLVMACSIGAFAAGMLDYADFSLLTKVILGIIVAVIVYFLPGFIDLIKEFYQQKVLLDAILVVFLLFFICLGLLLWFIWDFLIKLPKTTCKLFHFIHNRTWLMCPLYCGLAIIINDLLDIKSNYYIIIGVTMSLVSLIFYQSTAPEDKKLS
jgi:hypothetical protein